jgi:hypothetical protein
MGGIGLAYRPSGVIILGIFMIIFAFFNFGFGVYMYFTSSLISALSIIPLYVPVDYRDLVFGSIIGVVLLVDAVGLLSMTKWGYYSALVSSAILLGGCVFLFFWFVLFFLINLGSLTLAIITIAYLSGDAKYEYPI